MESALPCGSIEEFVLSSNRRKLLGIDNDTEDENMHDSTLSEYSSIMHGSDEYLYFHRLQIENEITNILINNNLDDLSESDTNKLKSLLNEANDIISKYEEKNSRCTSNNKGLSGIDIMTFRHKLRTLFLSSHINLKH